MLGTKTLTDVTSYDEFVDFVRDQCFKSHVSPSPPSGARYSVEQAMQTLFMRSLLENFLAALRRKKNVILQGPPGVGQTYADPITR